MRDYQLSSSFDSGLKGDSMSYRLNFDQGQGKKNQHHS
jgi:hypothetical protein